MAVTVPDPAPGPMLDHVAIGTRELDDGWELFGQMLGGHWAYGDDSPGYWWGQLAFARGPKIELLKPTGGPDGLFLERFLDAHGAGPHHYNFLVPDLRVTLQRVAGLDIRPVQVNLDNADWKEAFLHPRSAHGTVIQIAQQAQPPKTAGPPAGLHTSAVKSAFVVVEHHVANLDAAVQLFTTVLGGHVDGSAADADRVDLTWPNHARIRLVRNVAADAAGPEPPGFVHHLEFSRDDGEEFSPGDAETIRSLASRLGVSLHLRGSPGD